MRENLLKKQPTWGLRRAQGTGQKSATPATLTKVILVLLTMFLLPSAAWGVEVIKTITFKQSVEKVESNIDGSDIPVSVSEKINGTTTYSYSSSVKIWNGDGQIKEYRYNSESVIFEMDEYADIDNYFSIILPGNYPDTPNKIELTAGYANAVDDEENRIFAKIQVIDIEDNDKIYIGGSATLSETTLNFEKDGTKGNGVDGQTNRDRSGDEMIFVYLNGNSGSPTTFTIKQIVITYETNDYGLTVAGIPVTGVNADDILGDGTVSFTPAEGNIPATLTLNNANLGITTDGGAAIESSLSNLVVNLVGKNSITSSVSTFYDFKGNGSNTVTFATDVQNPGTLGGQINDQYLSKDVTLAYQEGLGLSRNGDSFTIGVITYGITIGETIVTYLNKGNILGNGTVSFTPADGNNDATLTLSGANIIGGVDWSGSDNLTIALNGENNSITNMDGDVLKNSNVSTPHPSLSFTKTENATSGKLTLTTSPNSQFKTIAEFGSHTGLYDLGETENEGVK